jgi:hypothetical protein
MTLLLLGLALTAPVTPTIGPGRAQHCQARCHWAAVVEPQRPRLRQIAWCESRARWHLNSGNGYYGGLQFSLRSWRWVGGRGYPHQASALEQSYRALALVARQGWGAWPVCARAAGW